MTDIPVTNWGQDTPTPGTAATVASPPPPPTSSAAERIVAQLTAYINQQDTAMVEMVDQTLEHLVQRIEAQDAAIGELQYQMRVLGGIGKEQYRQFIVEEARQMGVRPSDLMVKAPADDPT